MKISILTLFPEMITQTLSHSMIGRAQANNIVTIDPINIRDYSDNKHLQVDDYPYGGGAGMVMQPGPVYRAYQGVKQSSNSNTRVLYMTPHGKPFAQADAQELSKEANLIFLCGHYEGIDQRVIDEIVTDEYSVGDYILTGGELPAMVMIDSICRLIPGVLGKQESFEEESFSYSLLEHPHYTRPVEFNGETVPEVLLSGHHENIKKWRREQSLIATYEKRHDLLATADLSLEDKDFLEKYKKLIAFTKQS
ncbi:MAG TPA: tRNA (guanosine(37)-N1)-methyltransferase TrmD [Epulopiscium sp.]|nr:tRNA (guanosine(37)-N1)-methyltransferase TrmD [Candidatus Epulonipiscium sp.]